MSKRSGLYPHVRVDTATVPAVAHAGGALLTRTTRVSGIDRLLSEALRPWRKPLARHDPAKVVLDVAVSLALGGDACRDAALLRAEPGVYGPVASDATISRTIAALAGDVARVEKAIATARTAARAHVWNLAGQHAPNHEVMAANPLVIDLDATLVTAHSDKEQAAPTFKRGFGFSPAAMASPSSQREVPPPVVRVRGPRSSRHRGVVGDAATPGERRLQHRR